jgi:hypothetical protein
MKNKNNSRQKFLAALTHLFSLGVRSEKEASNASLSLRHLSLWLKSRSPSLLKGFAVLCGASPIGLCSEVEIGWDVTKRAHPAKESLAHSEPPRKTDLVQKIEIDSGTIVRVGSRHPFTQRNNGPQDVLRYGKKTPDESQQRANPGNGRVVDLAAAATPRFYGIPQGFLKPSLCFQTSSIFECVVALSGERLNAKRMPPLWSKLNPVVLILLTGCSPHMRVGSPQVSRAPELICVVVIEQEPHEISAEIAQAAIHACREGIDHHEADAEEKKP